VAQSLPAVAAAAVTVSVALNPKSTPASSFIWTYGIA
jgi:hypothetical protein